MNTKILVVDDEPDIRFLIKDILEDEGYLVEVAEHANQAVERKISFMPNLILLDIWMPEIDGVTLLKQWHEQKVLDCQVVMMSGHGTVETAVEATRYGAFDFIEKPLSTAKLLRTVKSALASQEPIAKAQDFEQPIGNSQLMQHLRQSMQALALDKRSVFLSGGQVYDRQIWSNYLFQQQEFKADIKYALGAQSEYDSGLGHNLFISEVQKLSLDQQQTLLRLIKQQMGSPGVGRIVVASGSSYELLQNNSSVLTELAECWKNELLIPDLNDRIEDIPELVEYFVTWLSEKDGLPYRHFGVAAQNMMRNHHWAGGLPELKMIVGRILNNSHEDNVELEEIASFISQPDHSMLAAPQDHSSGHVLHLTINLDQDMREAREYFEHEYLKKQFELCRYNVSELARKIGQERTNLYRKLKSLGLHNKK